eukprot:6206088-Amphidinium_carterae.1
MPPGAGGETEFPAIGLRVRWCRLWQSKTPTLYFTPPLLKSDTCKFFMLAFYRKFLAAQS